MELPCGQGLVFVPRVELSNTFFRGSLLNYRHPGPRRVWKGGSEHQFMTAFPADRVDPVDPLDPADPVDPLENSQTSFFDNPSIDFEQKLGQHFPKEPPKLKK